MGKHILLLDRTSKESLDLGKILSNRTGFQGDSAKILSFMADRLSQNHKLEITNDSEDLPEYKEEKWKELDSIF